MEQLNKQFLKPGKDFRSAPFWSWNDKLSQAELIRQAKDMKARGMGGFFMHSREGLETEYLGKEWMDCIKAAVKQARKSGMNAWLYDEDRWPSGFAGGLVTQQSNKYKAKGLTVEIVKGARKRDGAEMRVFIARLNQHKLISLRDASNDPVTRPARSEAVLVFRLEISAASNWYNKSAYSDNLDPDTVKAFIDTTYEAYKNEVGAEFGRTIPGMFTDEPNIAGFIPNRKGIKWIPWTGIFVDFFRQRRGYNILDKIPYFFFDGSQSLKIRHDYWKTIAELFAWSYSRQLGQWCQRNNILFTGHYLLEDNLFEQIAYGGAVMPQYEYQQLPGIDILSEQVTETLTVKQTASVAHQFGRRRLISELYGVTGWDFTFEGQKWVGDWQYALGVNLRCQHLALYTLRGCRKRDYPPSFNYQNTWWKYNNLVDDYFARLSLILSRGKPVRDIL
ncbi:MAG: glycosyl hydrolase, partial [Planctomycetota bacterium]